MKQKLLLLLFSLVVSAAGAQIPNFGWENWTNHSQNAPAQWSTFGRTSQVSPGENGQYAVKLQAEYNGDPGAVLYGNPNNNGFSGGTPFAARPDSLIAYLQYSIAANDSAYVIISFQQAGAPISNNIYTYKGSYTSGYKRVAFKIDYTAAGNADTVFIGFTSTDIDHSDTSSWVIVDNVSFAGTGVNVPNPDFETWGTVSYDSPDGWSTENNYQVSTVTKTTDAYSGNYAIMLSTIINNGDTLQGSTQTTTPGDSHNWGPAFPVSTKPDSLMFYAKYTPVNNDSAEVNVNLFKNGSNVGGGFIKIGGTISSYTPFAMPINYMGTFTGTPDSGMISISTFVNDQSNSSPHGASVLYVDNMSFDHFIDAHVPLVAANKGLQLYPNPAHNELNLSLGNIVPQHATVQIMDVSGKVVFEKAIVVAAGSSTMLDIASVIGTGMYFVRVDEGSQSLMGKIFKY